MMRGRDDTHGRLLDARQQDSPVPPFTSPWDSLTPVVETSTGTTSDNDASSISPSTIEAPTVPAGVSNSGSEPSSTTDEPTLQTPLPAGSSVVSSIAPSSTTSANSELQQNGESTTSNNGLSQGAKIGLGVGIGVGVALLLAAIILFCFARRRKRRNAMQMGGKYTPQAQSDLSMIETSYPVAAASGQPRSALKDDYYVSQPLEQHEPEQHYDHHNDVTHFEPPPQNVFETPTGRSPVTPMDAQTQERSFTNSPPALVIPDAGAGAGAPHSRELSPVRAGSPVSPVSPVSAVSPIHSRPPSPKQRN